MTKLLIVVTLIVVLTATYCSSETYNVKVGSPEGKSVYDPPTVNVNLQDIVLWEWVSGVHTVVQSDTPKSCQKSISTTAFTPSPILNEAGKTFQITITEPGSGKLYYFSNQGTDCVDGMFGTIVIGAGKVPADDAPTAPSSNTSALAAPTSTSPPPPPPSSSTSKSSSTDVVTPTPISSKANVGYKFNGNIVVAVAMAAIGVIGLLL